MALIVAMEQINLNLKHMMVIINENGISSPGSNPELS